MYIYNIIFMNVRKTQLGVNTCIRLLKAMIKEI